MCAICGFLRSGGLVKKQLQKLKMIDFPTVRAALRIYSYITRERDNSEEEEFKFPRKLFENIVIGQNLIPPPISIKASPRK